GDGRQDLYVASLQWVSSYETKEHTSSVKRYDGVTGAYLDTFVAPDSGGLSGPWLMSFARTDPMTLAYPSSVPTGAASAPVTTDRGQASALLAVGNSANSTVRETAGRDKSPPVSSSQVP